MNSLPLGWSPPSWGWKAGRFPEGQTRDRKENTEIRIPFVMARQTGVCARPAVIWAAQKRQSIHQRRLFMFFVGVDWSSDIMSQSNNRTSKRPSKGKYTTQSHRNWAPTSAEEGRAKVALPNSSDPLGTAQPESGLLELSPSAGSTPHHGGLAA